MLHPFYLHVSQSHLILLPGGDFHGCPITGELTATAGDADLNALKNRTPQVSFPGEPVQVQHMLSLPTPSVTTAVSRKKWSQEDLDIVAEPESKGIQLEGFLVYQRHQAPELCNCKDPDERDFHVWICPATTSDNLDCVVVEATPRWQAVNNNWNQKTFSKLKNAKAHVRITGWLLYDQDHGIEVGKSRATLWEIHPITKIEVEQSGSWVEQ